MKIPYGDSYLNLSLKSDVRILKMEEKTGNISFDYDDFKNFVKNLSNLLVIVNDHSRITPTDKVLELIASDLDNIKNLKFLVATGTHRKTTDKELKRIFGTFLQRYKNRISIHNGMNGDFDYFGTTTYHTKVYYNSILNRYDNILVIGGVEPHYFAGFSGGRKSIFPGIAAYQSIENNHKLALKEKSKILALSDNPVNLDIEEAVSFVKKNIYSIQVVSNEKGEIKFISQGDLNRSFYQAVDFAMKYFTVPVKSRVDLLIAVVESPFDRNFYQAHKGLENTKTILKKGGTMILVAECAEGIGNDNFYKLLKKSSEVKNILQYIEKNYKLGYHKTAKIMEFIRNHKLILISDIKKEKFENTGINVEYDLRKAIDDNIKGENSVAVVFNAAVTVPTMIKNV